MKLSLFSASFTRSSFQFRNVPVPLFLCSWYLLFLYLSLGDLIHYFTFKYHSYFDNFQILFIVLIALLKSWIIYPCNCLTWQLQIKLVIGIWILLRSKIYTSASIAALLYLAPITLIQMLAPKFNAILEPCLWLISNASVDLSLGSQVPVNNLCHLDYCYSQLSSLLPLFPSYRLLHRIWKTFWMCQTYHITSPLNSSNSCYNTLNNIWQPYNGYLTKLTCIPSLPELYMFPLLMLFSQDSLLQFFQCTRQIPTLVLSLFFHFFPKYWHSTRSHFIRTHAKMSLHKKALPRPILLKTSLSYFKISY